MLDSLLTEEIHLNFSRSSYALHRPSTTSNNTILLLELLEDGDFKASVVAYEVQKSFANKFFSNKTVAKSMIDDTSGNLLDNLYLLLYVFVSSNRKIFKLFIISIFQTKNKK